MFFEEVFKRNNDALIAPKRKDVEVGTYFVFFEQILLKKDMTNDDFFQSRKNHNKTLTKYHLQNIYQL